MRDWPQGALPLAEVCEQERGSWKKWPRKLEQELLEEKKLASVNSAYSNSKSFTEKAEEG